MLEWGSFADLFFGRDCNPFLSHHTLLLGFSFVRGVRGGQKENKIKNRNRGAVPGQGAVLSVICLGGSGQEFALSPGHVP